MPLRHRTILLLPLAASALAGPALAQSQSAVTNYAACVGKPSPSDSEAAHSAFLLGKRFFDEADYGSAIHNFVDAYKLDCTKTELLTIIARANELSGNRADAVHALETFLDRSPSLPPEERAQIQKRIDNLKAQLASQSTAALAPVPVPVPAPSATPPPPPPTTPPPVTPSEEKHHTVAPWIVTGVGAAALIGGGVVFLVGFSDYNSATSTCPVPSTCTNLPVQSEGNTGHTMMQIGGGVFIGGGALAIAGLIWHFAEHTGPAEQKASIQPDLGPGYAGLSGRF
jgi:hypothetical protein